MSSPIKPHWLDRAIEVYRFHVAQCKVESSWTISKTATVLNRSFGSVQQDIMLAGWSITHDKQLRRFRSMRDALAFVKDKEKEMRMREI